MYLGNYLKSVGRSQDEFGKGLVPPVSQGLISQWARGVTRVTLDYALQIERATGGSVTPSDCARMFTEPDRNDILGESPSTSSVAGRQEPA